MWFHHILLCCFIKKRKNPALLSHCLLAKNVHITGTWLCITHLKNENSHYKLNLRIKTRTEQLHCIHWWKPVERLHCSISFHQYCCVEMSDTMDCAKGLHNDAILPFPSFDTHQLSRKTVLSHCLSGCALQHGRNDLTGLFMSGLGLSRRLTERSCWGWGPQSKDMQVTWTED